MNNHRVAKVSQRVSLTCLPCAKSKVRCSKTIPCQRCTEQGRPHLCSREAVQLNTRKACIEQDAELRVLRSLRQRVEGASPQTLLRLLNDRINEIAAPDEDAKVAAVQDDSTARIEGIKPLQTSPSCVAGTPQIQQVIRAESETCCLETENVPPTDNSENDHTGLALTLEYLAWGRNYQPHDKSSLRPTSAVSESPAVSDSIGAGIDLPPPHIARLLVYFHFEFVCWHHNAIHSPTFLEQCEAFWESGVLIDQTWVSLYLSVLAAAAWCYPRDGALKFEDEPKTLAERWYNSMLFALNQSNFMGSHSTFSVQAIVISTLIAHPLGHSNSHYILLSAAVRIAQCLGLDKLKEDKTLHATVDSVDSWKERVENQTGRRVWWQLIIQDYFAVPFNDTYTINPNHFSTLLPSNCDDHELEEVDINQPTISSYCIVLGKMAYLMPQLVDGAHRLSSGSLAKHYQQVLEMDLKMRELVSQMPPFLLRQTTEDPNWPPWVSWARKTLTISAADKIIMIHRAFLIQSFRSPLYAYTRITCLSAALTILREYESVKSSDVEGIWIVSAFTISAAIIVALDLLYRVEQITETRRNRDLVRAAIHGLSEIKQNKMAARGASILSALLEEEQERRPFASGGKGQKLTVDFSRVSKHLERRQEPESGFGAPLDRTHSEQTIGFGNAAPSRMIDDTELESWFNESLLWNMTDEVAFDPLRNASFVTDYGHDLFALDPAD